MEDDLGDTCSWCEKKDVELVCSACKKRVYCGGQCQRAHWPGHKAECIRWRREQQASASTKTMTPQEEEEQEVRRRLAAMNRERERMRLQAKAEKRRQRFLEAFQQFMAGFCRYLLPRLPPCGPRDKVPVVVCGPAQALRRRVEPAGLAFLDKFERTQPSFQPAESVEAKRPPRMPSSPTRETSRGGSRKREATPVSRSSCSLAEARSKLHMHKARLVPCLEGVELFTLLGVELKIGCSPTTEDIKEAYRKKILQCHPDKAGSRAGSGAGKAEADSQANEGVLLVQQAYEYLIDRENREMYESTLPFDDWIPTEEVVLERGFFRTLRRVFLHNSKWSVERPVPDLGDANTPVEEVREFYRFWYSFSSWRDVSPKFLTMSNTELKDLYNCHRTERRSRQWHNLGVRRKFEVHESQRITKLVDLAWKLDPRLEEVRRKGRKQQEPEEPVEEEQVEAERGPHEEEQRRQEAELEAELGAAREEERQAEREAREEMRKLAKRRRAGLRKVVEDLHLRVDREELQRLCIAASPETLEALTEKVQRLGRKGDEEEDLSEPRRLGSGDEAQADSFASASATGRHSALEAIFEAMRDAGIVPTEPVMDPSEAEAAEREQEEAELARQERNRKRREQERKRGRGGGHVPEEESIEEKIRMCKLEIKRIEEEIAKPSHKFSPPESDRGSLCPPLHSEDEVSSIGKTSSPTQSLSDSKSSRRSARRQAEEFKQQDRLRQEEEWSYRAEEAAKRCMEAENMLKHYELSEDPVTVDRAQRVVEYMRIGGTSEAAGEVARAAIHASPKLVDLLRSLEDHRQLDPEGYADDVLGLLAECAVPLFELGVRPPAEPTTPLPQYLRTQVKRARLALRNMVTKQCLAYDPEPEILEAPARGPATSRARSSSRETGSGRSRPRGCSSGGNGRWYNSSRRRQR